VYSRTAAEISWARPATPSLRYQVLRDGTLLATPNGVSHYDDGLTAGRTYTFKIIAIARDGRRSDASLLMLSTPRGVTSSPTPAPPSNLRASASPTSHRSVT